MPAKPFGMLKPGNIDTASRPVVKNADGTISTVRTISIGTNEGDVLIPTVSPDGQVLSDEEAISLFERTGQHLGVFKSSDAATMFARNLHEGQADQYGDQPTPTPPSPHDSWWKSDPVAPQGGGGGPLWTPRSPVTDAMFDRVADASKGLKANQMPAIEGIASSLNRNEPGDADWVTPGDGEPGVPIIKDIAGSLYPFERNKKTGEYRPSVPKLVDAVIDAAKLPGDVASGQTDPMSEEGIQRGMGFATAFSPGAPKAAPKTKLPGNTLALVPREGKASIPTAAEIKTLAQQAYGIAEKSEIGPAATPALRSSLLKVLNDEGLVLPDGKVAASEAVRTAVKMLEAYDGQPMTFKQFQRLEEKLQDIAMSKKAGEGRIGNMLLNELDKFFENLPDNGFSKGAGAAAKKGYAEGKSGWAIYSKLRMLEKAVDDAELSKQGLTESLRSKFRDILKSERKSLGLSPAERQMMRKFVMGGKIDAVNEWLTGLRGVVAGTLSGGLVGALAVPLVGAAGKGITAAGARSMANQLRASVASGAGNTLKPSVQASGSSLSMGAPTTSLLTRTAAPSASLRQLRLDAGSGNTLAPARQPGVL